MITREALDPEQIPIEEAKSAEKNLFGAILIDTSAIDRIGDSVTEHDFYDGLLGRAFTLAVNIHRSGRPLVIQELMLALKTAGIIDELGGSGSLSRLYRESVGTHAEFYASEVVRLATLRRMRLGALRAADLCNERNQEPEAITERLESVIRLSASGMKARLVGLSEILDQAVNEIKHASESKQTLGHPTGMPKLDEHTGGFFPGELTLLAARTSVGKSALAAELAYRMSKRGKKIMFVSLEMNAIQIAHRVLARLTGVKMRDMQNGTVSKDVIRRFREVQVELDGCVINNLVAVKVTVPMITAYAKLMAADQGLDLVVVDHLGLLQTGPSKDQYERITKISRDLKCMAIEINKPVLALCQLNRAGANAQPTLENLRDSGALEQDADNVWLLHRDDRESREALLIIAKQRQGVVGGIQMDFYPERVEFNTRGDSRTDDWLDQEPDGTFAEFQNY